MSTMVRCAALLACAVVSGCGDSGSGPVPAQTIDGNWYLTDPSESPVTGLNQIGAALRVQRGTVTGNATVALYGANGECGSYGLNLPLTGSIDASGRLSLNATDNVDTFALSATLDPQRSAFTNGRYSAIGYEAYPERSASVAPCTPTGRLNGMLMPPVNATYSGVLATFGGGNIQVSLTTHQDTIPLAGNLNPRPALITHGNMVFMVGGFAVTGTMHLATSVCGVTTATIQPKNGYVWGTVLQIEFDTDSTYRHGATFATYIDPTTGALSIVGGRVYAVDSTQSCGAGFVPGGTLTRQ